MLEFLEGFFWLLTATMDAMLTVPFFVFLAIGCCVLVVFVLFLRLCRLAKK